MFTYQCLYVMVMLLHLGANYSRVIAGLESLIVNAQELSIKGKNVFTRYNKSHLKRVSIPETVPYNRLLYFKLQLQHPVSVSYTDRANHFREETKLHLAMRLKIFFSIEFAKTY